MYTYFFIFLFLRERETEIDRETVRKRSFRAMLPTKALKDTQHIEDGGNASGVRAICDAEN